MNKLVLIAAAVSAGALAGCATVKECEAVRDVGVRVVDDSYVEVDRDPIVVCAKDKWIRWVLPSTQSYVFTAEGVVIEDTDDEFTNCKKGTPGDRDRTGLTFRCHDKNNKHGTGQARRYYNYKITVQKSGSSVYVDPQIMND